MCYNIDIQETAGVEQCGEPEMGGKTGTDSTRGGGGGVFRGVNNQ